MKTFLASAAALAFTASMALADAPKATSARVLLSDAQMDQVKAGQRQRNVQYCDFAYICVQANQQNRNGDNYNYFYF